MWRKFDRYDVALVEAAPYPRCNTTFRQRANRGLLNEMTGKKPAKEAGQTGQADMISSDCLRAMGLAALLAGLPAMGAQAQTADDGAADVVAADAELPEIDIIQDTPTQRKRKKKQVQISPLSKAAPKQTAASSAPAAPAAGAGGSADTEVDFEAEAAAQLATVPSAVSSVTPAEITRDGTMQLQNAIEQNVPSTTLSDAAGNPTRAELQFRGFDASPVNGRAQGLAVYQNGIRINEAFGDSVNWSFIPTNAIENVSIISNNPAFGLNALGGAASIVMRDGFSFQGAEFDIMAGSFGRIQTGAQAGMSSGNAAVYAALEGIWEDGFRDFSDTKVRRMYADVGLRGSMAEVHLSFTGADNLFGATAAAPVELTARRYANTFTSPQDNDLEMYMPSISGTLKVNKTLSLSGVAYYRYFKSKVIDGNVTEAEECTGNPGFLCLDEDGMEEELEDATGTPIAISDVSSDDDLVGSIERLNTKSRSWGAAFELQEKAKLFNRPNQFIFGVSYDHGKSNYTTSSELGEIGPRFVVTGSGIIAHEPDDITPRNLDTENTYWGIYFNNTFDVTDQLTVTVGGRYNYARIKLTDLTGEFPDLNATNTYERFNPLVGANYKIMPGLSVYGGYSESNRAPTPAELGCAEPENPCLIESFLTDDPPLKQVVGRTAEIGLRGQGAFNGGQFAWGIGLFRTLAEDDILVVPDGAEIFFVNGGDTLRQGVELYARYGIEKKWNVYGSYAFIDATLDKCAVPDDEGECAFIRQGGRLPGIPRHLFKAGFQVWLTPKWKFGADVIASGDRPFFRNAEGARDPDRFDSLSGYTRVDLHTSYDVNDKLQIYGLVKNLFDQEYGLYGTYFEADEVGEVDEALGGPGFTDNRTVSPSQPFAFYGGVKMRF